MKEINPALNQQQESALQIKKNEEAETSQYLLMRRDTSFDSTKENPESPKSSFQTHSFSRLSILPNSSYTMQPKLKIGASGDRYEQEADRIAEQVIAMPKAGIQRTCSSCGKEEEENIQRKPLFHQIYTSQNNTAKRVIQHKCNQCLKEEEEEKIQAKSNGKSPTVASSDLISKIKQTKGRGKPLDTYTRGFMESRFGADFSQIKLHTDDQSAEMNQQINARAFTIGQDIYFNQGQLEVNSLEGKKLLAHELTHTLQQSKSVIRKQATTSSQKSTIVSENHLVDDELTPGSGQMKKSEFLQLLSSEVCSTVDQELVGTSYSTDNCPYIRAIFSRHASSSAAFLEQLIVRYQPGAAAAQSASDLISLILIRVRRAVKSWKQRGSLADVPENISELVSGMMNATLGNDAGNKTSSDNEEGEILFKANPGGATPVDSPQTVLQSLGKGSPIDSGTRGRMESALGANFSQVKVHTDNHASGLASKMNSRAFTVGNHIAFGTGEHKPGTLIGDALMAHELAHVIQQSENNNSIATKETNTTSNDMLEEEADLSAINAVISTWGGLKRGISDIPKKMMPKIRTGLKLQSCRRTVKQCPRGKQWSVVGQPTASGPVCICVWRCLPPGVGFSLSPSVGGSSSQKAFTCANKDRYGRCPGEPNYETVDDDYEIKKDGESQGTKVGVGAHMSPLGAQALCGCLPLDIEGDPTGDKQVHAPLLTPGLDLTDLAGMRGRSRTTGIIQPGGNKTKDTANTGKKPPAIVSNKTPAKKPPAVGDDKAPAKSQPATKTPSQSATDYKEMTIPKLKKAAKTSPEAANALLDRYRNNMGLKRLKDKYKTDETAKAIIDEYYDKTTPSLRKLEQNGDTLAKQVLDDLYGTKDSKTGRRPYLEEKPSDPKKTSELKGELPEARERTGIERKDLRRELKKKQLEGGTIGVGSSDIPGLESKVFEGASPRAGGKADSTFKPPSDDVRAIGHAEQNLTGKVDAAIQTELKAKRLTLGQLEGKTVRFHIEQEVCSVCRQGLNPDSTAGAGVLKQFSNKYPSLTIEVTASGTSEVIRIKGGKIITE